MKIAKNCQCKLSCDLLLVRNGEKVGGMIGTYTVDYII